MPYSRSPPQDIAAASWCCRGTASPRFRTRRLQLWQIVLSPHGVPGGYQSIR